MSQPQNKKASGKLLIFMNETQFLVDADPEEVRPDLEAIENLILKAMVLHKQFLKHSSRPGSSEAQEIAIELNEVIDELSDFQAKYNAIGLPFTLHKPREIAKREGWTFREYLFP